MTHVPCTLSLTSIHCTLLPLTHPSLLPPSCPPVSPTTAPTTTTTTTSTSPYKENPSSVANPPKLLSPPDLALAPVIEAVVQTLTQPGQGLGRGGGGGAHRSTIGTLSAQGQGLEMGGSGGVHTPVIPAPTLITSQGTYIIASTPRTAFTVIPPDNYCCNNPLPPLSLSPFVFTIAPLLPSSGFVSIHHRIQRKNHRRGPRKTSRVEVSRTMFGQGKTNHKVAGKRRYCLVSISLVLHTLSLLILRITYFLDYLKQITNPLIFHEHHHHHIITTQISTPPSSQ